ncbi:hypothetical protein ADK60_37540 [Streptomyces sp. XY431]|uniref:hypothetical protein n=1 Tax=Streptomyces sp. XY431 TaxID=1415562 RepID=UPI0006AF153F|nr:hypothetical protein [Streptomyces sp. XY431]KOV10737.1 hypothetical protein ADK60_37540 [Streptomyces sp. XY431]
MLTITTTARLGALRQRADQADTALTDTARQLKELREEHHGCGPELAAARAGLEATPAESGQALVAEAKASEAVTRLLLKDASARIADRDRTITDLRAALEQARTGQPAEPELPEHTMLRFRTVGGGTTVVTGEPRTYWSHCQDKTVHGHDYAWKCVTCGDDSSSYTSHDLADMRRRANEHAAVCRAIPAGTAAEKAGATT